MTQGCSSNSLLELELQAADTAFQANETVRDAFGQHIGGAQWMVFADKAAQVLHWDYVSRGSRFVLQLTDGWIDCYRSNDRVCPF